MQMISIAAVLIAGLAVLGSLIYSKRNYDEIDGILDSILAKEAGRINLGESRSSKLRHKAAKIVRTTHADITRSTEEKETVQQFISDLSHQMKTPLSSVSMYTELLLEGGLSLDEQKEFLMRIVSGTEKLRWMMDSLVDISRLEVGAIMLTPLKQSLRQTLTSALDSVYAIASKKNITIHTKDFRDVSPCHDRKWTVEAFMNLLENAVKYSEPGKDIHIDVEHLSLYTRVNITDYGVGIPSHEWNNIFKRFYRGKNTSGEEGVGIGLYLVRLILEKQGGYIMVDSVSGQYTTFSAFLQNC